MNCVCIIVRWLSPLICLTLLHYDVLIQTLLVFLFELFNSLLCRAFYDLLYDFAHLLMPYGKSELLAFTSLGKWEISVRFETIQHFFLSFYCFIYVNTLIHCVIVSLFHQIVGTHYAILCFILYRCILYHFEEILTRFMHHTWSYLKLGGTHIDAIFTHTF